MHFPTMFVALGAASVLTSIAASPFQAPIRRPFQALGMTAPEVVSNINMITTKSLNLQTPAYRITIMSGPLFLIGQGPWAQVMAGLEDLTTAVEADVEVIKGSSSFKAKSDEDSILRAVTNYVAIQREFLNILIGKAGTVEQIAGLRSLVGIKLTALEVGIDAFVSELIDLCGDTAEALTAQLYSLEKDFETAIAAYSP